MKAWALRQLSNGRYYRDGLNDVTPALYPTRARAVQDGADWRSKVVRVNVVMREQPLRMRGEPHEHPGWAVAIGGRRWARDGRNDVTPALFRTRRDCVAWKEDQNIRGQVVRVWVAIYEV